MVTDNALQLYKDAVFHFCAYSALAVEAAKRVQEKGRKQDAKELSFTVMMADSYKDYVLASKEEMGFTDGLAFTENNRFLGFELLDGKFSGDRDKVLPIVEKWVEGFPESANNYQYEAGLFALCMAHPDAEPIRELRREILRSLKTHVTEEALPKAA